MRKMFFLLFILALPLVFTQAPALRGPDQVMAVLQKSKIDYEITALKDVISADNSHKPNPFGYFKIRKGNTFIPKKDDKKYNQEALKYLDQADYELIVNKFPRGAREWAQKALKLEPKLYTAMNILGQTYAAEKNYDQAITWYKKSLKLNYMNSSTHRYLARSYKSKQLRQEAIREITIALVLDRRHQSVVREFYEFYKDAGLSTAVWTFTPQIRISKKSKDKVKIEYKDPWLSYALAKAAWRFEPDFREAAGVSAEQGVTMIEEFECVYNLAISLAKVEENQKLLPLKALEEAVWNNMVYEFIFFEVVLQKNPFLVYQLPDQGIEKIADYVIAVRGKLSS
jgi:tetratricopeptide (TPR) repeat protein